MHKSQNTFTYILLFALTLSVVTSTGCKLGSFPKMPDNLFKKDSFRLSGSSKDTISPPSRTFDPKPSHFATMDNGNSGNLDVASNETQRPTRKPYDVDESNSGSDNFGFPKNADSLFGNNTKATNNPSERNLEIPQASEFRQAMNNTVGQANEFADRAQKTASQTFDNAKDFVAGSAKSSGDFVRGGGDFVVNKSQDILNKTNELARDLTPKTDEPKWKSDFALPAPESRKPERLANQFIGKDFQASVAKASEDAKKSMTDFNQKAMSQVNQGFNATKQAASDFAAAIPQSTQQAASDFKAAIPNPNAMNQQLTKAAGQFEKSWQDSVDQAKQTTEAIRNSTPTPRKSFASQPNVRGDFQPSETQPTRALARTPAQPKRTQRALEITPQVEFDRPKSVKTPIQPSTNTNADSQFAVTGSNAFRTSPAQTRPVRTTTQPLQPSNGPAYPSTNYSAYGNQGPDRISQVTPIDEPATSQVQPAGSSAAMRTSTQPLSAQSPVARTASLPSELLQGNSNYAPGSVKQLSPIK